jgi:hypothetical protein
MKRAQLVAVIGTVLWVCGCPAGSKKPAAQVPAAPAPAAPQPASGPLSVTQTQVALPPAQVVPPEAYETAPTPTVVVEPSAPPRTPARRQPAATRTETPAPAPAAAQPEPTRAPVQEIVPADVQKRLQESAQNARREIKRIVDQANARHPARQQKTIIDRIESFVRLSDEAEGRGDMRQASELADRALVLARELPNAN